MAQTIQKAGTSSPPTTGDFPSEACSAAPRPARSSASSSSSSSSQSSGASISSPRPTPRAPERRRQPRHRRAADRSPDDRRRTRHLNRLDDPRRRYDSCDHLRTLRRADHRRHACVVGARRASRARQRHPCGAHCGAVAHRHSRHAFRRSGPRPRALGAADRHDQRAALCAGLGEVPVRQLHRRVVPGDDLLVDRDRRGLRLLHAPQPLGQLGLRHGRRQGERPQRRRATWVSPPSTSSVAPSR